MWFIGASCVIPTKNKQKQKNRQRQQISAIFIELHHAIIIKRRRRASLKTFFNGGGKHTRRIELFVCGVIVYFEKQKSKTARLLLNNKRVSEDTRRGTSVIT